MDQGNPPIQEPTEKTFPVLKRLDFTQIEHIDPLHVRRIANYCTTDGRAFRVVARHLTKDLGENSLVEQELAAVQVDLEVKSVDSLPAKVITRLEKAAEKLKKVRQAKSDAEESGIIFEIHLDEADAPEHYYQVDFKVDPPISEAGTSPNLFFFGVGDAVSINVSVTSNSGTITASVYPGNYTRNGKTIDQGQTKPLGAISGSGATFIVQISGSGEFTMGGTYYTQ